MGFYVNDTFWEDIKDLTPKQQNELMGAWTRLAFTGEEPAFTGFQQTAYKFGAERVLLSKKRCEAGGKGGKQKASNALANAKQNASKTLANSEANAKQKSKNGLANALNKENENEIRCVSTTHTPNLNESKNGRAARHNCKACGRPTFRADGFCDECAAGFDM